MPNFDVRFVDAQTQLVSQSVMAAESEVALRLLLAQQGHVFLSAHLIKAARAAGATKFDVAWWCRELRTLLRSGMTVVEAVETFCASRGDASRHAVHEMLLRSLRQGLPLSEAMESSGVFPDVLIASIRASERTSTLVNALDDYLRYDEALSSLRRKLVSAAIYPMVVVSVGLLITLVLLVFVIPRFSLMYRGSGVQLSGATQIVLWLSAALREHAGVLGLALLGLVAAVVLAFRQGAMRRALLRLLSTVPALAAQWRQFLLAKMYQALALMYRGGYTLDEALEVGERLELGAAMQSQLRTAREAIARGQSAALALATAGLTDPVTERLLAVGERTGDFDQVMQTVADRHAQTFMVFVERATRVLEPLMMLLVALLVGGVVVMMYLPIFDMANGLGQGNT